MSNHLLIVAGSYERLLYGLSLKLNSSSSSVESLDPEFIYPAHIHCIKALSGGHRFLASGSSDEHIKLYDLKLKKEVGNLMHHVGSITCLQFYQKSHLMTASEDGTIGIVRTSDWELLKTLTGHKYAVNWIDIHPSGKVMLSVGKEGTLKCWDLQKGNCAYSMKLPVMGDRVAWSPQGDFYVVLMNSLVQIHTVASGEVSGKIEYGSRVNCILTTTIKDSKQVLVTGGENQKVAVWDMDGARLCEWSTQDEARVKDMDCIVVENQTLLVTCASNGKIKVWNLNEMIEDSTKDPMVVYDAKCRLTCVLIRKSPIEQTKVDEETEKTAVMSEYESEYEVEKPRKLVKVIIEDADKKKIQKKKATKKSTKKIHKSI